MAAAACDNPHRSLWGSAWYTAISLATRTCHAWNALYQAHAGPLLARPLVMPTLQCVVLSTCQPCNALPIAGICEGVPSCDGPAMLVPNPMPALQHQPAEQSSDAQP